MRNHAMHRWYSLYSCSSEDEDDIPYSSNYFESLPWQHELELTEDEANRLFMITDWPEEFRSYRYEDGEYWDESYATPEQAAARIDHFIATEGRE